MLNQICYAFQTVFNPSSTSGRILILSLFLYLFLLGIKENVAKKTAIGLGAYYVVMYIVVYMATVHGSTLLGHGSLIGKILSCVPLVVLIVYFVYRLIVRKSAS